METFEQAQGTEGMAQRPQQAARQPSKRAKQQKQAERRQAKKKQAEEADAGAGASEKKARLRTSQDIYNRIMWDASFADKRAEIVIGYLDRFDGMMEIDLPEFIPIDKGGDIAYHRIYHFRQGDLYWWDRNKRIDRVFGSGEKAATASGTTDANGAASSASEDETDEGQRAAPEAGDAQTRPETTEATTTGGMPRMRSCGILLFAEVAGSRYFLLMKHARRYDLPKGHVEKGETDRECALREVFEETGIKGEAIKIDPHFVHAETYYPVYKRLGGKTVEKTVRIFLGQVTDDAPRDPSGFPVVRRTEHGGHEWVKWNPPHHIQKNTIDPLLKAVNEHFKLLKELEREKEAQRQANPDHEEEEDGSEEGSEEDDIDAELERRTEVAEEGSVERVEDKEKAEKERQEKFDKDKEQRNKRRVDYNARKTRRQRNALVAGGGYALLDKVRDETGRGQVGIYSEGNLVFPESALNTQAKLILKRNDKANKRLDENVHKYAGDDDSEDDEVDPELVEYYSAPRRSAKGKLGEFMDLADARPPTELVDDDGDDDVADEAQEWACTACTYVNKPSFLCCEMCASQRS